VEAYRALPTGRTSPFLRRHEPPQLSVHRLPRSRGFDTRRLPPRARGPSGVPSAGRGPKTLLRHSFLAARRSVAARHVRPQAGRAAGIPRAVPADPHESPRDPDLGAHAVPRRGDGQDDHLPRVHARERGSLRGGALDAHRLPRRERLGPRAQKPVDGIRRVLPPRTETRRPARLREHERRRVRLPRSCVPRRRVPPDSDRKVQLRERRRAARRRERGELLPRGRPRRGPPQEPAFASRSGRSDPARGGHVRQVREPRPLDAGGRRQS
jgi:hypothetical protein